MDGGYTIRNQLAENLRVLRLLRGWSQEELAEAARLDRSYVGGIERAQRNVSLDKLELLARAFGLTIPQLLAEQDPRALGEQLILTIREAIEQAEKER